MINIRRHSVHFAWIFLFAAIFFVSPKAYAADGITIDFPTDRGIFQRDYSDTANVSVAVSYEGSGQVRARIVEGNNVISGWSTLDNEEGFRYSGIIPSVKAGGWYQLEVAAYDDSGSELASETIEHIGVGEVFITGGQSNSCNFGGAKTSAAYDTVSAYDAAKGVWQHCEDSQPDSSGFGTGNAGGSPWPTLGDELTEQLGVPVGFCTTGFGGSTMEGLCTEHYGTIKQAITGLSPYGYRAFLIHQGEADTDSTPMENYRNSLLKLIDMTRDDAGYDLVWIIAQVSYAWSNYNNTAKMEAITSTQRSVCNNYDIFTGPTTDDLLGDYRHTDNLHLSEKGLIEHGKRWADVIISKLFTKYQLEADSAMMHGRIDQCVESYYAGEEVTLTAHADDGYYLIPGSFKVTGEEGEIELSGDTFKMRAENLTVTAEFAQLPKHLLELGSKIKEAELIDVSQYEGTSVNALRAAIEAAKQIYANPNATEIEAVKAYAGIVSAMTHLVKLNNDNNIANLPVPAVSHVSKAVGDIVKAGNLKYKITKTGDAGTVSVIGLVNKNKTSVKIPAAVTIDGTKYKVTAIAKKAFEKAEKLKRITIKSSYIKSIGKKAFSNVNNKLKIKVPVKKYAAYKKLIKKSGYKKLSGVVK